MDKPAIIAKGGAALLTALALTVAFPVASAGDVRPKTAPVSRPLYVTQAPIVLLKDLDSGAILFSRGAEKRFAPASMAKVMTAYVVLDLIKKGGPRARQAIHRRRGDVEEMERQHRRLDDVPAAERKGLGR